LKGINSVEETANLVGGEFVIPYEEITPLEKGSYYPFQLIGWDVFTEENQFVGKITEIYPVHDQVLYEIKKEKKEYLVPGNKEFIKKIDLNEKKVILHLVEGLFE
jgi:16S rRNA processing protein RimM